MPQNGLAIMRQFWVQKSAVGPKWSNYRLQIWSVLIITWYLHLENWKIPYGSDLDHFWGTGPFWGTKITRFHNYGTGCYDVWNLAGLCGILMFKMSQCENFQFLSLSGPMEMGLFWVQKCPFRFKFGLCIWFLDISTGKTWERYLGTYLGPFWGNDPFWAPKLWGPTTMETVLQ